MPSLQAHLRLAQKNRDLLDRLLPEISQFSEWITTIAFYRAIHLVEAMFAIEGIHHFTHEQRESRMGQNPRKYGMLYRNYHILSTASKHARYLGTSVRDSVTSFDAYISFTRVKRELIETNLLAVETMITGFITTLDPDEHST